MEGVQRLHLQRKKEKEQNPDLQMMRVKFDTKEDMIKVAHTIIFEKVLMLNQKKLHMRLHKKYGDYNPLTSIFIGMINPRCTEDEIIEELNLILRDDRNRREKEQS